MRLAQGGKRAHSRCCSRILTQADQSTWHRGATRKSVRWTFRTIAANASNVIFTRGIAMRRKSEAGQAVIFTALALTVLLGFAGLGIDMGVMRYEKRLQQTAADSAAIAGADDLRYNGGSGVTLAAQNASAGNGFTDNSGGAQCTDSSAVNCIGVTVN